MIQMSVIMAAHNAEKTIGAALHSLIDQELSVDYEIVVIDDASSDQTVDRIRNIRSERITLLESATNVGRAAARNLAIASASGAVLVVADSDDVSMPGRLQFHWDTFVKRPDIVVSSGQLRDIVDSELRETSELSFPSTSSEIDQAFARGRMGVAHPACAFRRSWFEQTGGYDPTLPWCEDYDLFARGWTRGGYLGSPEVLVGYRRRTSVTDWPYWWENQRHHAAINARIRDSKSSTRALQSNDSYIRHHSKLPRKVFELARYVVYRTSLRLRAHV